MNLVFATLMLVATVMLDAPLQAQATDSSKQFIAGAATATVVVDRENGRDRWKYEVTFATSDKNHKPRVEISLPVFVALDAAEGVTGHAVGRHGQSVTWRLEGKEGATTIEFSIAPLGDERLRPRETGVFGAWLVDGNNAVAAETHALQVPQDSGENDWWRLVLGLGYNYLLDDETEFQSENGALRMTVDSPFRTVGLVGIGFEVHRKIDALISAQFGQGGGTGVVDGVVVGLSWKLKPYLGFLTGFSARRGNELAAGFQHRAAQIVAQHRDQPDSPFSRFRLSPDGTALLDDEEYDGFPLSHTIEGRSEQIYPHDPVTGSYNRAFIFGFVVPIEFSSRLAGAR